MKKILIIHPLKHHVYNSIYGIINSNNSVKAFLGIYKNNFITLILKILKQEKYIKGYYRREINEVVFVDLFTEILFLLSKKNRRFNEIYMKIFQKRSKKFIDNNDIIHVIQDYCNESLRYARDSQKVIVYEQIIAFDTTIKKYLEKEVEKWEFSKEYLDRNYNFKKISLSRENIKFVNYILSPSEFVTKSLTDEFGEEVLEKIISIPYGVDTNKFKYLKRDFSEEKLNLLCVSRVTLTKGTKYLIESMKILEEYNVHLTLIGMPVDKEDKKMISEIEGLKNITYISKVPHSYIDKYFKQAHVFILPTLIEGSALSIYEALSSGLPVITTQNAGSVINDKKEGFIIPIQDINSIIEIIKKCNENRELLSEMSINARKRAEEFSWEIYSDKIKEAYKNIIVK